jgi:L-alanine-DL-glutamate epimerase-like enolase superfamily enzyme
MRITDVTTTQFFVPDLPGIKNSTNRHQGQGRGSLFVHIKTDDGLEGLAPGIGESRGTIERALKSVLIGQDPLYDKALRRPVTRRHRPNA